MVREREISHFKKKRILKVEWASLFSKFGTADLHFARVCVCVCVCSRKQRQLVSVWEVPQETWKQTGLPDRGRARPRGGLTGPIQVWCTMGFLGASCSLKTLCKPDAHHGCLAALCLSESV